MKKGWLKLLVVTVLVSCFTMGLYAKHDEPEVDQLNFQDQAAWSCARTLAIEPFAVPRDFKGKMSREKYESLFQNELAEGLRTVPGVRKVVVLSKGEVPATDIVISGHFTKLTTGSRAARFWIGFGAGRSKCGVQMEATTVDGKTPVFELKHARISAMGLKSDELVENIGELCRDIVGVLSAKRTGCPDVDRFKADEAAPAEPARASISMESQPEGADVYVDGEFVGNTPIESFPAVAGKHKLEFRKKGFKDWSREMEVPPGAKSHVSCTMDAVPAPPAAPSPDAAASDKAGANPKDSPGHP